MEMESMMKVKNAMTVTLPAETVAPQLVRSNADSLVLSAVRLATQYVEMDSRPLKRSVTQCPAAALPATQCPDTSATRPRTNALPSVETEWSKETNSATEVTRSRDTLSFLIAQRLARSCQDGFASMTPTPHV